MDARFGEARAAYKRYMEDPAGRKQMDGVLVEGGKRARAVARQVLARCYDAVGIQNRA
jgi:hypothetical protein